VTDPGPTAPATLRDMLAEPELLILPGVYDALTATLAEQSGFRGLYLSGAAVSMALIGHPDLGFATLTELAGQAARMRAVTTVPIVADADTGYGNAINVVRTVREYEQAGVAGIQLEDQTFPKRCGHLAGKSVAPANEFAEKVHAAREARRDPATVLIARTDARRPLGYDEAVTRANAYAAAGADLIFIEAPETAEEIARIPGDVSAPVMFNVVRGGYSPVVSTEQLTEWGYAMAILPGALITPVVRAVIRALEKNGAPRPLDASLSSPAGLFGVVGLDGWLAASERYATD
jgi:2-methylisocitrate lyase-like PEP mutase family enzyme